MVQIDKIFGSAYLGRNAGRECYDLLKKAKKEVKIISPYLSPEYIRKLIKLNSEGVSITLITCDNVEERGDFNKKELLKQNIKINEKKEKLRNYLIIFFGVLTIISLISSIFNWKGLIIFTISLTLLIGSSKLKTKTYTYEPIFKLKVFSSSTNLIGKKGHLIHSKIYIIDDIAFLGSMNFTKNGFINSYESSVKIINKEAVEKIKEEINWIYKNYELKEINLNEWGKELFKEPRN